MSELGHDSISPLMVSNLTKSFQWLALLYKYIHFSRISLLLFQYIGFLDLRLAWETGEPYMYDYDYDYHLKCF